jgi:hypothetical protein
LKNKNILLAVLAGLFIFGGYAYQWMSEQSIAHDIKAVKYQNQSVWLA